MEIKDRFTCTQCLKGFSDGLSHQKPAGGGLNETQTFEQILNAKDTKTSKLQPNHRQDRACRIELADFGSKIPLVKSILPSASWMFIFL